jgi:uncharacterized protein YjbI with pentapeptide repeats
MPISDLRHAADLMVWTYPLQIQLPIHQSTPWWKDFPWAALAAVASFVSALIAVLINKRLSERQFERKSLADEFTDILNRFSSENPIIRANAAIRLGEMAGREVPAEYRFLPAIGLTAPEKPRGVEGNGQKSNPVVYPFFSRAVAQLAAALHMEEHSAVRAEVGQSLSRLADQTAAQKPSDLMLLIHELARANRRAKTNVCELLSKALACPANEVKAPAVHSLSKVATFCEYDLFKGELAQLSCLNKLVLSKEYGRVAEFYKSIKPSQGDRVLLELSEELMMEIKQSVERLIDVRDALQATLVHLPEPKDLPEVWKVPNISEGSWQRHPNVKLDGCFVAGIKLDNKHLEGISFEGVVAQGSSFKKASLQGAKFALAGLQCADFGHSDLRGAYCIFVEAESANFWGANLKNSYMAEAHLEHADFTFADLDGADLTEATLNNAELHHASLREAVLSGAVLRNANLSGANLCKAKVEGKGLFGDHVKADFTGANWWEAEFWDLYPRFVDRDLPVWLQANFPTTPENFEKLSLRVEDPGTEHATGSDRMPRHVVRVSGAHFRWGSLATAFVPARGSSSRRPDTAPPGSPDAVANGCTCLPTINENGMGLARPGIGQIFYPAADCPLHGLDVVRRMAEAAGADTIEGGDVPEAKDVQKEVA